VNFSKRPSEELKEEEEKKEQAKYTKQTHRKYTLDSTYLPTIIIHTTVTKKPPPN